MIIVIICASTIALQSSSNQLEVAKTNFNAQCVTSAAITIRLNQVYIFLL